MSTPDNRYIKSFHSTLETWNDLIEFCLQSEFYKKCLEDLKSKNLCAQITLIWAYLHTFSYYQRVRLEEDAELFYQYAESFVRELSPYKYSPYEDYDSEGRKIFLSKIRKVLKQLKSQNDEKNKNRYFFLKNIIHLFSSVDKMVQGYDLYKSYVFRYRPKIKINYDYYI